MRTEEFDLCRLSEVQEGKVQNLKNRFSVLSFGEPSQGIRERDTYSSHYHRLEKMHSKRHGKTRYSEQEIDILILKLISQNISAEDFDQCCFWSPKLGCQAVYDSDKDIIDCDDCRDEACPCETGNAYTSDFSMVMYLFLALFTNYL